MNNEWQPARGWEGKYEVSARGEVRKVSGKMIGQYLSSLGYAIVRLAQPRHQERVHRLVAFAFIENPNNLPMVNHIDSNRLNNDASNLEWCDQKHNLNHARSLGRMPDNYWKGKMSPGAKLSDDEASKIRKLYATGMFTLQELANKFLSNKRTVGKIVNNKSYLPLSQPAEGE